MEKIMFDSGVREYTIGSGVLRFNPADPNVYARFLEAAEKIQNVEQRLVEEGKEIREDDGAAVIRLLTEADREAKDILNQVFAGENDFHSILGGVNLLAVATNGERVITNLFAALEPVLTEGARQCAQVKVEEARRVRDARVHQQ